MNVSGRKIREALGLLLLQVMVFPGLAVAQHSASASETVSFAVVPVHTMTAALAASPLNTEKVTVSVEPASDGIGPHPGLAVAHTLLIPLSPPIRPPRGSSVIMTITD